MTTVSPTTSSTQTASETSQSGLMANYDLFLSILTTQIQNQDPLNPMDSGEYTSQLVQYSSVEQSIQTNKNLEQMIDLLSGNQSAAYVSYLGSEVKAAGGTAMMSDGQVSWAYNVSEDAEGTVEILNENGSVVYTGDIRLNAGGGTYTWDGETSGSGTALPGAYTIKLDVKDSAGNAEPATIEVTGIVDEVDFSEEVPVLWIGNVGIPVSAVKAVRDVGA